jgi:3-phenylpropionate/cinnamic acid dioxygenase small subunit
MPTGPRFTLQEISDRLEIDDVLSRYTFAIDTKDFDALDDVFTPDATIDYTTSGGIKGTYPEVKAWLAKALRLFPTTQHLLGNKRVTIDGDAATSRTHFYNPMVAPKDGGGGIQMFYVGGYYNDRLVRTPDGWRIADRFEETAWMDGALPTNLEIPT